MRVYKRGEHWWCDFSYANAAGERQRYRGSLRLPSDSSERTARQRASELRAQLEQEAMLRRAGVVVDAPAAADPSKAPCPFSGLAKRWHDQGRPHWSESTAFRYATTIRLYLHPWWGHREARDINVGAVRELQATMTARGLGNSTVNCTVQVLGQILKRGVEEGFLTSNPARGVKKIKRRAPHAWDWYDAEEAEVFMNSARKVRPDLAPMFLCGLRAGLRPGELLALNWGDVDLEGGFLVVRRTVTQTGTNKRVIGKTTKGGAERRVPLASDLRETLRAERHLRSELVFCRTNGERWSHQQVNYGLRRVAQAAGLREIRVHDLRHSFASQLVARGVSLKVVSELLGHKTIKTTEIYAHLAPSTLKEAVEGLAANEGQRHKHGTTPR